MLVTAAQTDWRKTTALFKFVERGLATRSPATVTSVTPGVAMLCHQRVDDAWRALWPPNVTHARAAFTNAVEVKGGPRRSRAKRRAETRPAVEQPALYSQFQAAETAESYIISALHSEQEIHKSQN